MGIRSAQQQLAQQLAGIYETREAANIADWVIEHITGKRKTDRLADRNMSLSAEQEMQLATVTSQLLKHRPVQYVLGEAWFCGMKFFVDENVLIPRPETEELVEWVIKSVDSKQQADCKILDIGCGSGCISISIQKKLPATSVTGIDISEGALETARRNSATLSASASFLQNNFLDEAEWHSLEVYDIIVSNPPYIKRSEEKEMMKHVVDFEPPVALFVPDDDALIFYRKIAAFAKEHLVKGGSIFMEINETLGEETKALFEDCGYHVELRTDLQGKARMLKVVK